MSSTRKTSDSLDRLILGLEEFIVAAPDEEILSQSSFASNSQAEVRRVIDAAIENATGPKRMRADRRTNPRKRSAANWSALRRLLDANPDLSPRLAAVFGAGKVPTSKELDDLSDELSRLGYLPKGDPK